MESIREWLRSTSRDPKGPSSQLRSSGRQSGRSTDHLKAPLTGTRDLGDSWRTKAMAIGGAKWTYLFFKN